MERPKRLPTKRARRIPSFRISGMPFGVADWEIELALVSGGCNSTSASAPWDQFWNKRLSRLGNCCPNFRWTCRSSFLAGVFTFHLRGPSQACAGPWHPV